MLYLFVIYIFHNFYIFKNLDLRTRTPVAFGENHVFVHVLSAVPVPCNIDYNSFGANGYGSY